MRAQRTLAVVVLLFVVAALSSAQTPEKPKPSGGQAKPGTPKAAAAKLGTAADEEAVRALPQQYQQAFNSDDPRKAADIFAQNGVFVDETGKIWDGKAEIEKNLTEGNRSSRPRLTLTTDAVRFIRPDVALMRGKSMVEGGDAPPGGGGGHWAVVAMKVAGHRKVVAAEAAVTPPPQGRGR